ncbi:MAG: response regulator [Bacteroidales bacterium]|nr:response regulator [Bacteroidales bacterium]HPD95938.1 response regulator [Tenuifilaceae bacterium]
MTNIEIVDVLMVEDNPQDAELAIRALKKGNFSNNIYTVEDGAEALDFLYCKGKYINRNSLNKPKVVLLDLKLPKISGLEVLEKIKGDPSLKKIPVVVVTSSKEDPDIKRAYELGVNSYVVKPVDFEKFIEGIKNLGFYWLLINQPST